jgi:hypothetical protein
MIGGSPDNNLAIIGRAQALLCRRVGAGGELARHYCDFAMALLLLWYSLNGKEDTDEHRLSYPLYTYYVTLKLLFTYLYIRSLQVEHPLYISNIQTCH